MALIKGDTTIVIRRTEEVKTAYVGIERICNDKL
jgi:hypothetical protein